MVDITDPVRTIVGLLKSSSTGIGTTGYEITNDAEIALTISNGDILVSYALSREELKDLFGGSQDYDIIITVRKGEVEDDWIGLSTKQWKVPVIIEVNIIDKWSGAGTNLQTITAALVREKAENAIRKFIKNKTNAPGGSVHRWLGKTYRDEEDRSLKPIIFKCTITTESWTYYDPPLPSPICITLALSSELGTNSTIENYGNINIDGEGSGCLPDDVTITDIDSHTIEYIPEEGYLFDHWEVVCGDVTIIDTEANPTTFTINSGDLAWIKAVFIEGGC